MTTFHFRDAELINRLALVGVAGQSRAGKTLTALRVAHGIASVTGGKVAGIDTEAGRMLEYGPGAKPFGYRFKYAQFDPPFTGDRYLEILLEAEKVAGPNGVIVVDSMSHEHEGDGGVLEQHEELVRQLGEKNNMTAWNRAKEGRKKLINYIRSQRKCHLIMCFRAEQKTGVAPGGKPVDLGVQLIGWAGWPFEMSMFVMLNRDRRGAELRHDTTAGLDQLLPEGQITEKTGEALARWCKSGNGAAAPATNGAPHPVEVWLSEDEPEHSAADITAAGRALYKAIRGATEMIQLGMLEHNNADLIPLLPEAARKAVKDLFAAKLADLRRPATLAEELEHLEEPWLREEAAKQAELPEVEQG
jgi:hypothetical protein